MGDGQKMTRFLLCGAALLALANCAAGPVPDSGSGVGFGDYDSYNERQAAYARGVRWDETDGEIEWYNYCNY